MKILCLIFAFFSFAANANKIAIVNFSTIEGESKVTQNITKQIQERQEMLQKEVKNVQDNVQKKVDDLEKSSSVLTAKALEQKKANLQKELVQIDENLKAKAQRLENIKNDTLLDLNNKIKKIVEEVAKKNGYDIALAESAAIFYDGKYDITQDVLKELNKQIPSVKINWDK